MKTIAFLLIAGVSQAPAVLVAQADGLGGGTAGWASFGVAGLVLSWLLFVHLPGARKEAADLLKNRDELMERLLTQERASCEKRHADNLAEARLDREERARQHQALLAELKQCHEDDKEGRHATKDVAQAVLTWTAVVKQIVGIKDQAQAPAPPART